VHRPENYPWSSYRANALGEPDPLLSPHGLYLSLGTNAAERQTAYRNLFSTHLDPEMLGDVRACLQTGTPLGNDRFREQIEQTLGVKVGYSARGRPKKPVSELDLDVDRIDLNP